MSDTETSPDVCYRHPKRESWVLCQRCGRTICPECQILAPVGVQCPECVKEAGGSVNWQRVGGKPAAAPRSARSARPVRSSSESPRWVQALGGMLRPGSSAPALTWIIVALTVILWLAGFFVGGGQLQAGLPFDWLAARYDAPLELWRYFTATVAYPSLLGFSPIFSVILGTVFFLLNGPAVERTMGRPRFMTLVLASGAVGASAMVIVSGFGYGLIGALFGLFGAYLIQVWSYPPARVQVLIMIGINLILSLALGGGGLPAIVGGLVMGAGATYLFQRYDDHARSNPRTPYLIVAAVVAGFIVLAIIRSLVAF